MEGGGFIIFGGYYFGSQLSKTPLQPFFYKTALQQQAKAKKMVDSFDLVVPTAIVVCIALPVLAPIYLPYLFAVFALAYFSYFLAMCVCQLLNFLQSTNAIKTNIKRSKILAEDGSLIAESAHCHLFIIPNYAEPIEVLRKTIHTLANHSSAKSHYVCVLAMEASEVDCGHKASLLVNEFGHSFKTIITTIHPAGLPDEAKGKGSNVNYAVRQSAKILTSRGIPMKQMVLTILDADATIPELYVSTLEKAMVDAMDPYNTVFCPPTLFSRNALQVPALVRCADIAWSIMVTQNLSASRIFPCSSYSLTLVLADRVGYWDCDMDATGEDFHMMLKCFYKSDAKSYPIHCPINYSNVQTDDGIISNILARFVQAKRHAMGCADVSYCLKNTVETPESKTLGNIKDRIFVAWSVLEGVLMQATSSWVSLISAIMFALISPSVFEESPFFTVVFYVARAFSMLVPFPMIISFFVYEHYHSFITKTLFSKKGNQSSKEAVKKRSWIHLLDFVWLPVVALCFITIPYTITCFHRLIPNNTLTYITSEKRISMDDEGISMDDDMFI